MKHKMSILLTLPIYVGERCRTEQRTAETRGEWSAEETVRSGSQCLPHLAHRN